MSGAQKIAISAAIGGTAEALGGGKFANGAVTGAYVMALNHMGHQIMLREDPLPSGKEAIRVGSFLDLLNGIDNFSKLTGKEIGGVVFPMKDGSFEMFILPWDQNDATTCLFDPARIPVDYDEVIHWQALKFHSHLNNNGPSFPDFFENSSHAHFTPNMYKRDFVVGKSAIFEINRFNGVMAPRGLPTGSYLAPKTEWLRGNFIGL